MMNDNLPRSIQLLTDKFIELHGDRTTGDDTTVCVGLAWLEGKKLILISRRTPSDTGQIQTQSGPWKIIRNVKTMSKLPVPIIGILCGKPTSVDRIILALADCIIVPKDILNANLPIITGLIETDGQSNSLQTSKLRRIVSIDGAQVISALRQMLPGKIDELISISPANLIAQRIDRLCGRF